MSSMKLEDSYINVKNVTLKKAQHYSMAWQFIIKDSTMLVCEFENQHTVNE